MSWDGGRLRLYSQKLRPAAAAAGAASLERLDCADMRLAVLLGGGHEVCENVLEAYDAILDTLEQDKRSSAAARPARAWRRADEPYAQRVERVDTARCASCGGGTDVDDESSELRCRGCGSLVPLEGVVFDDSQFYCHVGQRAKSGTFNPGRHFEYWMQHIQALEDPEEVAPPAGEAPYAERLRAMAAERGLSLRLLTVRNVRHMLHAMGRSKLYNNAALLLSQITGTRPPQLASETLHRGSMLFARVVQVRDRLPAAAKQRRENRGYYPYYIYKILDELLPADSPHRRVLFYIYLQGNDTLRANDLEWSSICSELKLPWRPTVAHEQARLAHFAN